MFWLLTFYVIGGVIGVLMNLRFVIPIAYYDVKNVYGFWGTIYTIFYQLFRNLLIVNCVVFFCSWISVGFIMYNYDEFKDNVEAAKNMW